MHYLRNHLRKEKTLTDEDALKENYVSIMPAKFDLIDYQAVETMKTWF
jgi:broad specificity polyphosphatase/5'/3'-nucleotidase SurE